MARLIAIFSLLFALLTPPLLRADADEVPATPPLHVKPYRSLLFPTWLEKNEIQRRLQGTVDRLFGVGYVFLGDMRDFMHMHLVMKPLNETAARLDRSFVDVDPQKIDWTGFEPAAFLIHTKENPDRVNHIAQNFPGPFGELGPYSDRSWVLWLTHGAVEKPGQILDAHLYGVKKIDPDKTVRWDLLSGAPFGSPQGLWEVSVYFFRVDCEALDARTPDAAATDNLIEIHEGGQRMCLVLENFFCRNHPEADACREGQAIVPISHRSFN